MGSRYIFIVLSILLQSMGGLFGKFAAINSCSGSILLIFNIFYILAIACMMFQAIAWQQALKHFELSYAYPFMSLVNFVILILANIFFQEKITFFNIAGLIVISAGIYYIYADQGEFQ